jgi:hypothetical protein
MWVWELSAAAIIIFVGQEINKSRQQISQEEVVLFFPCGDWSPLPPEV